MKKLILISIFILLSGIAVTAQTAAPQAEKQVVVNQSFVDDAARAFNLVVTQREALAKFANERASTIAERDAANALVRSMDELLAIKDKTIAANEKLVQIYSQMIEIQQKIITQLENRLTKPKSFYEKLLQTLKEVVILAAGISIGRGL